MQQRRYLNNAATTWPKPESVYDAVNVTMRGFGSLRRECGDSCDVIESARITMGRLLNAPNPERIILTPGCTFALNMALEGLPWNEGDGIVISAYEHHAVSRPARRLAERAGVTLHVIGSGGGNAIDLDELEKTLSTGTVRLVCCMMASNVTGTIFPVEEVARLAHEHGSLCLIDAAQTAGTTPVDVRSIGCDMLAVAGHKGLFGPAGVGALWVSPDVDMQPLVIGGTGGDSGRHELGGHLPGDHEAGTLNAPAIAGLEAGMAWVLDEGVETIRAHEQGLCDRLLAGLEGIDGVHMHGERDTDMRTSAVSLTVDGWDVKDAAAALLERHGIVCRAGFHCAPLAHESIGTLETGGTVRVSPGYFTTDEEVDAVVEGLRELACEPALSN